MIKSFRDKETRKLFERERTGKFPPQLEDRMLKKLLILDAATNIDDLRVPPGNRLKKLKNDRVTEYSIRINDQWRLCFKWKNGDAYEIEIVDYH